MWYNNSVLLLAFTAAARKLESRKPPISSWIFGECCRLFQHIPNIETGTTVSVTAINPEDHLSEFLECSKKDKISTLIVRS